MKTFLILFVVVLVAGGIYALTRSPGDGAEVATPSPSSSVQPLPTATAAASPSVSPVVQPSSYQVTIQGFAFAPKQLTVKRGDTVTFTNKDSIGHTATSLTDVFDSGILAQNKSFTLDTTTLAPGTYEYKCTPHPSMRGTIIVKE